jgi:hypothetical protein
VVYVLLPIVKFMHFFEYRIVCLDVCIVHVYVVLANFVNVIFFKVFRCLHFLPVPMTSIVSVIVTECTVQWIP